MADLKEKKGIFVDPIEWAHKHRRLLKTVTTETGEKVSPEQMLRDRRTGIIKKIQENVFHNLNVLLSYKNYVMFHKVCYSNGYTPTQFIEKLNSQFETNNEDLLKWLGSIKREQVTTVDDKITLTEDEMYAMLEEEARKRREK